MPNPVSIIVWRDAKADPPTVTRYYFVASGQHEPRPEYPSLVAMFDVRLGRWTNPYGDVARDVTLWAELPVVSDLTDEDVRNIAVWALDGERLTTDGSHDTVDRFRAALGGEKEET